MSISTQENLAVLDNHQPAIAPQALSGVDHDARCCRHHGLTGKTLNINALEQRVAVVGFSDSTLCGPLPAPVGRQGSRRFWWGSCHFYGGFRRDFHNLGLGGCSGGTNRCWLGCDRSRPWWRQACRVQGQPLTTVDGIRRSQSIGAGQFVHILFIAPGNGKQGFTL